MIKKILLPTLCGMVLTISGCSIFPFSKHETSQQNQPLQQSSYIITEPGSADWSAQADYELPSYPANNRFYASHKQLDDYVAQLAMQLYHTSVAPMNDATVAVAGFAELTPARHHLHPLGNELAERFLQQLPRYGLTMVDHKLTGAITLTAQGDAVFSNRAGQVVANQRIDYVLSGTVQHGQQGVQVNVRIMNLKNKTILASASQFIPQFVLENGQTGW
ncbi:FlgO family outer membrane protein [Arsukibacterium indicum]|uniref:FlgO domain-containing protein n=1 Tax=Arsukibacterium indicum TaxID=2848612 RepID=A0ABS6MHW8_9GAMM|nr:FlgO family outer membrane protein [Arsukibacterium indicum]MBV2127969.1 hypothetical protein [Arsukibacterium indicum]